MRARRGVPERRRIRARALAWIAAASLLALAPRAAESAGRLDIQAELDRRQIAVGEAATLTVTVTAEGVDIPPVTLPPIAGVTVERLGQSEGFSWINGRVTRTVTIAFRLHPADVGPVTIPAIRVTSGEAAARSMPLILVVGKSSTRAQSGTPDLFARVAVDKQRAYWNEAIVARFTLYSRVEVEVQSWDPPDAAGFWTEQMGPPRTGRVLMGGVEYDASELRVTYFPTRTGRLRIGPGRVSMRVVRRVASPDPWSMLGMPEERVEDVTLETGSAPVEVLALPPGAPPSFKGAVGNYSMDVRVDRTSVRAGEPVTVTTILRGVGNVASAGDPDVVTSVPTRTYAGGATTTIDRSGERVRGERRREVTFIAEAPGRMSIVPVRYTWFDPGEGRYRTQISDSIRVVVEAPGGGADSARASRPVGPVASLRQRPGRHGRLGYEVPAGAGTVAVASLLAYAAAVVGLRVRRLAERDPRRRRAAALASLAAHLHDIGGSPKDGAAAAIRIAAIARHAVGLRYDVDIEGLPTRDALDRARAAGASAKDVKEVEELLTALDRVAFAPPGSRAPKGFPERKAAERLLKRYVREIT
jgi:oxygen tolerance protein BatD